MACDTLAVRLGAGGGLEVLLIERGNQPYGGCWALPGGFVEEHEDLPDAAARELEEETGLRPVVLDQVGAWGTPGRDPRGRTVSVVYVAVAGPAGNEVQGADDAVSAAWHPVGSLPPLAFDHAEIVPAALAHLRRRCERTHVVFAFLGGVFRSADLRRALDALGCPNTQHETQRLLAAACVERTGEQYRLRAADFRAPLREPVALFPVEST